jgi:hypothetical protein
VRSKFTEPPVAFPTRTEYNHQQTRPENPRVGSSILSLAILPRRGITSLWPQWSHHAEAYGSSSELRVAPPGHSVQAPIVERPRFERIEMGE